MTNVPVSIHMAWNIISFLESKLLNVHFFFFCFFVSFFLPSHEQRWNSTLNFSVLCFGGRRWIFALVATIFASKECRTEFCGCWELGYIKKRRCKSRQLYSVVGFWLNSCLNDLWHYTLSHSFSLSPLFLHFPIKIVWNSTWQRIICTEFAATK